ncbi:MAG: hypothetical protein KIT50_12205 [Bacteroidetes bacterium]|nr:hypothetical protein [Bacteroidota bacterium]
MHKDIESLKKDLTEVAQIVNSFKSESVQLKVLEYVLHGWKGDQTATEEEMGGGSSKREARGKKQKPKTKTVNDKKEGRTTKRGRPGQAAILTQLITEGFFKKKRTIGDIITHCGSKMAHHYKPNELSGALARFVRDKKLDREKNAEDQFEYFQK